MKVLMKKKANIRKSSAEDEIWNPTKSRRSKSKWSLNKKNIVLKSVGSGDSGESDTTEREEVNGGSNGRDSIWDPTTPETENKRVVEIVTSSSINSSSSEREEDSGDGNERPSLASDPTRSSLLGLDTADTTYSCRDSYYAKQRLLDSVQGKRFKEVYKLGAKLGCGTYSTVREGVRRDYDPTHHDKDDEDHPPSYAMKIVRKEDLTSWDEGAMKDEIDILKEVCTYKHIIRLYDVFEEKNFFFLVTEKMSGGELYDRIAMKERFNEREARDVSETLISAMGFCHSRRIAHRDLKPANVLMMNPDDDTSIKVADFGFAKRVKKPKSLSTKCGTPQYVAPEVLSSQLYDTQADIWSIGVIIFTMLTGQPPFHHDDLRKLVRMVRNGNVEYDEQIWCNHSDKCKQLVSNLLVVDPDERYDAQKALSSEWFNAEDHVLDEVDLDEKLKALNNFNAKQKFKSAVMSVIAANRFQFLIDLKNAVTELNLEEKSKSEEVDLGNNENNYEQIACIIDDDGVDTDVLKKISVKAFNKYNARHKFMAAVKAVIAMQKCHHHINSKYSDCNQDDLHQTLKELSLTAYKKFNARNKFKSAVKAVVATKKLQLYIDLENAEKARLSGIKKKNNEEINDLMDSKNDGIKINPNEKSKLEEAGSDCTKKKSTKLITNLVDMENGGIQNEKNKFEKPGLGSRKKKSSKKKKSAKPITKLNDNGRDKPRTNLILPYYIY